MFQVEKLPLSEQIATRRELTDGFVKSGPGEKPWRTYDSPFSDYQSDFEPVLKGLKLSEHVLKEEYPVVVDLMASAAGLRDLFNTSNIVPEMGIAVAYEDIRSRDQRLKDILNNIVQIRGDLTHSETWLEIEAVMGAQKAKLIVQRGRAGVDSMPVHRGFYNHAKRRLWSGLCENNGMLVTQVHNDEELRAAGIDLSRWICKVQKVGIDSMYVPGVPKELKSEQSDCYGLIKLVKSPSSPVFLPSI